MTDQYRPTSLILECVALTLPSLCARVCAAVVLVTAPDRADLVLAFDLNVLPLTSDSVTREAAD